jgi:hypothetical protein
LEPYTQYKTKQALKRWVNPFIIGLADVFLTLIQNLDLKIFEILKKCDGIDYIKVRSS